MMQLLCNIANSLHNSGPKLCKGFDMVNRQHVLGILRMTGRQEETVSFESRYNVPWHCNSGLYTLVLMQKSLQKLFEYQA